jgi:type IV secretion system protein VirD4
VKVLGGVIGATIVALSFGAVLHLWPFVHGSDPDWFAYAFLFRLGRLMLGVVPIFVGLVVFLVMSGTRSRVWAAGLTGVVLAGISIYLSWYEYARLLPFTAQGYRWSQLGPYIDTFGASGAGASLLFAFLLPGFALMLPEPRRPGEVTAPKRSKNAVHGMAELMTMAEVGKRFPPSGTVVIGERYRVDKDMVAQVPFDPKDRETWGRGGTAPLICYDPMAGSGPTHIIAVSGSGGYKTTSIVVPNCLRYPYSVVVIDPDRQAYEITKEARKNLGQRALLVTPDDRQSGFNVLDWIDPADENAPEQIARVVSWVCNTKLNGREAQGFFSSSAEALVNGLLAYVIFEPGLETSQRTLKYLRELISEPGPKLAEMIARIIEKPPHPFVKLALGPFVGQYYATISGVLANAHDLTKWLTFAPYADIVSSGRVKTSIVANGRTSVFLGIGVDVLGNNPGLARTLIGSLLNATKLAGGSLSGRVLFIVDEAARLGHMKVLEEMRDTGRKYGITLIMLYQSLGQIRAQWGGEAGLSDWMQSTGCQIFGAINDQDTAERISKKTGTYTAEVTSTSTSTVARGSAGGSGVNRTTTTNLVSVPLIRPSEITQNMRADEQIVFFGSMSPIRCGRAIYFRRPEMLKVAGEDRFTKIGKPSASPPSPEQPKA